MKPQSCKAKGRNLCKEVKALLLEYFPVLKEDDIKVTSSGATGEDLQFSPACRELLPYSIECKHHAKYAIYKDYKQACSNAKDYEPILIIKQNHSAPLAIVDLEYLLDLLKISGYSNV